MVSLKVVCGGGLWVQMKPYKNKVLHEYSCQLFICKSKALEVTSLSPHDLLEPPLDKFPETPRKNSKLQRTHLALSRVRELDSHGNHSSLVNHLMDLGMDIDEIEGLVRKFPSFLKHEHNIKAVVDLLLGSGVGLLDIPKIVRKVPRLITTPGIENIRNLVNYLEKIGMAKEQCAKAITRFPLLLENSPVKVDINVNYLRKLGLSDESTFRIITQAPPITSLNVETNLKPTVEYLQFIGLDIMSILLKAPETICLSIENKLKRVVNFFLERGCDMKEVRFMLNQYPKIFTLSVEKNLVPKWSYLTYMGYSKDEVVRTPCYFGYSLEKRIKPRFEMMIEYGVRLPLDVFLYTGSTNFDKVLEKKRELSVS